MREMKAAGSSSGNPVGLLRQGIHLDHEAARMTMTME